MPPKPLRILYLCHNHPAFHAGDTEIFAHELFKAVEERPAVESLSVAATDTLHRPPRPGAAFQAAGRSANEMLLWVSQFDLGNLLQRDSEGALLELAELVAEFRPDIVHLHHLLL